MVSLGFLKKENVSKWGTSYFDQKKAKNRPCTIPQLLQKFKKLIKLKPYPMTKISEILLKIKGFKYDM